MAPPDFGDFGALEMIQGIFSTIFVVVTIYIGLVFISKYFEHKNRNLYIFGFFWIGAATFFVAIPLQFFLIWFGITTPDYTYLFTMYVPLPIMTFGWLTAITSLLYFDRRNLFLRVFLLIAILLEISFFVLFFIQPDLIARRSGYFYMEMAPFGMFYVVFLIAFILFSGIFFGRSSLDSNDPEIRMKGRLIIISIMIFAGGAAMDIIIPPLELDLVIKAIITIIARILMSSSGILFYIGFMLPNWSKKILFRKK